MSKRDPVEIDATTGSIETLPPKKKYYACRLDTIQDVKTELGKLYREARLGKVEAATATKLTYILGEIRKTIETGDIERRIEKLEGKHDR